MIAFAFEKNAEPFRIEKIIIQRKRAMTAAQSIRNRHAVLFPIISLF